MAKEHIELLEAVREDIVNDSMCSIRYICTSLRGHMGSVGLPVERREHVVEDICSVIDSVIRPLSDAGWNNYGINSIFASSDRHAADPDVKELAKDFRLVVIDALIEDFRDELIMGKPQDV